MEDKKLLYYLYNEMYSYDGEVITSFFFKDIETGKMVRVLLTRNADKYNAYGFDKYYSSIDEIKKDYNILWLEYDRYIAPLSKNYEEVKKEYDVLLNNSINNPKKIITDRANALVKKLA